MQLGFANLFKKGRKGNWPKNASDFTRTAPLGDLMRKQAGCDTVTRGSAKHILTRFLNVLKRVVDKAIRKLIWYLFPFVQKVPNKGTSLRHVVFLRLQQVPA